MAENSVATILNPELLAKVRLTLSRVKKGECDLRYVGSALNGRWDQDYPREILEAIDKLGTLWENAQRGEIPNNSGRGGNPLYP